MPRPPTSILHVRVHSPRLLWLGFTRFLGGLLKLTFFAAALTAVGWAFYQGYQRVVLENPDFQLRVIDLNPNPVIDEAGLAKLTRLDLSANLTRIDTAAMAAVLDAHPAIIRSRIERHLPDTLVVRVTTRIPVAWLATSGAAPARVPGALLVDVDGVPYPCPDLQLTAAAQLPCIRLQDHPDFPVIPGTPLSDPQLRHCMRLIQKAAAHSPAMLPHIDTLAQPSPWSIQVVTRDGVEATFGLREQASQLVRLETALAHSREHNISLATINLIPRENVPVTLRAAPPPPRAIPVPEPTIDDLRDQRRRADLRALIDRP